MLVQSFGIATVLVAVMAAAPAAHAGAIFPIPDPDGFYYAARNLDAAQNGDVLNSRLVPTHPFPGATVWQILFRSTNSTGAPIAAVTILISPGPGPRPGRGPRHRHLPRHGQRHELPVRPVRGPGPALQLPLIAVSRNTKRPRSPR
ncbi:hypothetical protein [Nocardia tengchongensis]